MVNKTTILHQILYAGVEGRVLQSLGAEDSLSRSAELLDADHLRMRRIAREHGMEISAALNEHERGLETARSVLGS